MSDVNPQAPLGSPSLPEGFEVPGYLGPAAHTWTTGCDGAHPIGERCRVLPPPPGSPPATVTPGQAFRATLIDRWTARNHPVDSRSWDELPEVDRDDMDAAASAAIAAHSGTLPRLHELLAARRDHLAMELAHVTEERDQARGQLAEVRRIAYQGGQDATSVRRELIAYLEVVK